MLWPQEKKNGNKQDAAPETPKKTYVNGKKIEIVCRLCAKTERGSTNIFSKVGKEKNLPVVIEKLTGIVVSVKDALPKTVCRACQKQLLQYVNFKNRCLQVQATLRNVTVKRCKELSPQPTKKRILSENPPEIFKEQNGVFRRSA